jgi:hypothetical protein
MQRARDEKRMQVEGLEGISHRARFGHSLQWVVVRSLWEKKMYWERERDHNHRAGGGG